MCTIYVLKLNNDKYYVGRTNDLQKRLENHKNGLGSEYTKRHVFVSVEKIIDNANVFDEDRYTLEYMAIYGIDNVRGGSYTREKLSDEEYTLLNKQISNALDVCFKCHKKGHFAKYCPQSKNKYCERCYRTNHYADACYAKKDIYNNLIENHHVENQPIENHYVETQLFKAQHVEKINDSNIKIYEPIDVNDQLDYVPLTTFEYTNQKPKYIRFTVKDEGLNINEIKQDIASVASEAYQMYNKSNCTIC